MNNEESQQSTHKSDNAQDVPPKNRRNFCVSKQKKIYLRFYGESIEDVSEKLSLIPCVYFNEMLKCELPDLMARLDAEKDLNEKITLYKIKNLVSHSNDDTIYVEFTIQGDRDETDVEYENRVTKKVKKKMTHAEKEREKRYADYLRLQEEFGGINE